MQIAVASIHAPYGGEFYTPKYTSSFWGNKIFDYEEYRKIYFTDDTLASLMRPHISERLFYNRHNDDYISEYKADIMLHLTAYFYSYEESKNNGITVDNDLENFLSVIKSYVGAGLAYAEKDGVRFIVKFANKISPITGAIESTYTFLNEALDTRAMFEETLYDAVYGKKFNHRLVYRSYHYKTAELNGFYNTYGDSFTWDVWDDNMYYINRYDDEFPDLRGEVTPFEKGGAKEYNYKDLVGSKIKR